MYPEDVESIYEMVQVGEKVTVVNQPFVFGWHDGQLYLQAYDVLEDDPRDWQKAQKKLLSRSLAQRIQAQLKSRAEAINWDAISKLAHDPRGIPVSISAARRGGRRGAGDHARVHARGNRRRGAACPEPRARRRHLGRQIEPAGR
jgi:L,D-transpeptidase ErfK/SrfK